MPTVRKVRKGSTKTKTVAKRPSSLPTSPNVPPTELLSYVLLIFGRKAIGKTTLASMLARGKKKVLVIMLEKSRKNLKIFQLPKQGERYPNWKRVKEYVDDFIKSIEFDVIVFDTLDRLYDLCFEHVCKKYEVKSPSELGRDGSGVWVEIAAEFNELLLQLADSGKGIVFLSHEKIRELEAKRMKALKEEANENNDSEESKIERVEPSASPAACRAVEEMCDVVMYYGYENRKRVLTIRDTGDFFWVGCNIPDAFCDPDGNEINKFYAGESPAEAKSNLFKAYNNQLRDINYRPPKKKTVKKKVRR